MKLDIDANHDPLLFVPPLNMPVKFRGWKGTLGYQRNRGWNSTDDTYNVLSRHAGVDLLTDRTGFAEPVYAVTWGKVVKVDGSATNGGLNVGLLHKPYGGNLVTHYMHLQDVSVAVGDEVRAGALLGHVKADNSPPHLHFELRRLLDDSPTIYTNITESIPLDPTQMLYRFEVLGYPEEIPQTDSGEVRKEVEFTRESTAKYRAIDRVRVLQWEINTWLFEVIIDEDPHDSSSADAYYLPVNLAFEHERRMIDQLERAFDHGHRVRLNWRESFFFAHIDSDGRFLPRKMIEGVRIRTA